MKKIFKRGNRLIVFAVLGLLWGALPSSGRTRPGGPDHETRDLTRPVFDLPHNSPGSTPPSTVENNKNRFPPDTITIPLEDLDKWFRVETSNFTLFSNATESEIKKFGSYLELSLGALSQLAGTRLRSSAPT